MLERETKRERERDFDDFKITVFYCTTQIFTTVIITYITRT